MKILVTLMVTFMMAGLAQAQSGQRIKRLSSEINQRLQNYDKYKTLSADDRRDLRWALRDLKDLMDDMGIQDGTLPDSHLFCAKGNNGLFYPADKNTGNLVGGLQFNAGHQDVKSCKETLPQPGMDLACFKWNNGLYYPTDLGSYLIAGGVHFNAGHKVLNGCSKTLPDTGASISCFKWNNGRYYPTRMSDYTIVGSAAYNASFATYSECDATL